MPNPGRNDVHVDRPLTNISIAYMQSESRYIADKIFPLVPVEKQSDLYYTYDKADWFRDEAQRRAPGTESEGSGYGLGTDSYSCQTWAFHKDVPWDIDANADPQINMYSDATKFVTQRLLMKREILFATRYFNAGIWATNYVGVPGVPVPPLQFRQWNDYVNSDPISDIGIGIEAIKATTGYKPNTLVLGGEVVPILKNHPDILDRYKYTQAGIITLDLIAAVFDIERIVVGDVIVVSNNEGQIPTYQRVFGKNALLCYAAPAPNLLSVSAGYTFAWKNLSAAASNGYGTAISRFEMRALKADRVEGEMCFDQKVVATDLGAFYSTCVA
jgi:hypothetical protein